MGGSLKSSSFPVARSCSKRPLVIAPLCTCLAVQIDLRCEKCKSEPEVKALKRGVLICSCPKCGYAFRMKISGVDELEISF